MICPNNVAVLFRSHGDNFAPSFPPFSIDLFKVMGVNPGAKYIFILLGWFIGDI